MVKTRMLNPMVLIQLRFLEVRGPLLVILLPRGGVLLVQGQVTLTTEAEERSDLIILSQGLKLLSQSPVRALGRKA